MRVLVVDNRQLVFNLVQYLDQLGVEAVVGATTTRLAADALAAGSTAS